MNSASLSADRPTPVSRLYAYDGHVASQTRGYSKNRPISTYPLAKPTAVLFVPIGPITILNLDLLLEVNLLNLLNLDLLRSKF
eukprot:SAG31_NODE_12150_length_964_cov_0.898266_1_plen_83_part_00